MSENQNPSQVITQEQFEVLLDNDKKIQSAVNDTNAQLGKDRQDIDQLKIDQGTIKQQQAVILQNFADLKDQIKQTVKETTKEVIKQEVAKAVKKEFNKYIDENPDKVIKQSFWDWILRRK